MARVKQLPTKWNGVALPGVLLCLLVFGNAGCRTVHQESPTSSTAAVRAVLEEQVKDWNDGSIVNFMRGYERSATTRFASGGEIRQGWQTVLERYQAKYGDKAAMGKLTFSDVDISMAGNEAALVFGRWRLERQSGELHGLFTLFFRKNADGWPI